MRRQATIAVMVLMDLLVASSPVALSTSTLPRYWRVTINSIILYLTVIIIKINFIITISKQTLFKISIIQQNIKSASSSGA